MRRGWQYCIIGASSPAAVDAVIEWWMDGGAIVPRARGISRIRMPFDDAFASRDKKSRKQRQLASDVRVRGGAAMKSARRRNCKAAGDERQHCVASLASRS